MFTGSASFTNGNETCTINKKQTDGIIEKKMTNFSENLESLFSPKS